ncbi:acetyl-CoA carboxylase biotin carboxylase subunit family protein [Streptomyces sp. NPDC058221]|uniref:ATP-grasp domain-containing protein n=1 Tax=Streptomyces sp. NPDC058221 TaxID=3346388 RepID=UPI0036E10780
MTTAEISPTAADRPAVLYLGLRRSPLEWRAEIDAAAACGLNVHVASDANVSHTGLPEHRRGSFDRGAALADQAAEAARTVRTEQAGSGPNPAAVVCWGDKYVALTALLAERFGVRGIGATAAAVATDKVAQRRAMEPFGLNPPWRAGRTVEELTAAVAELGASGRPLVFKSAHCSGGRGMAVIGPDSDPDAVFALTSANYSGTNDFLVEEYVEGSEHSVSGVVHDGTVRVLGVTDKYVDGQLSASWATAVPSARTETQVKELRQAAEQAVLAVGLGTGGFHADLRFGPEGPVVLEVGGRLGGDLINSHLIPYAHMDAVRPYETLLTLLAGGELPGETPEAQRGAAMVLLPKAGRSAEELVTSVRTHPKVVVAEDWPGTESVVAVVVTEDPALLPGAVADVRESAR